MTVIVPPVKPTVLGVKVMLRVQLALAARLVPQLLVCAKPALATMLEMVKGPVVKLVIVTIIAALVVLRVWGGKLTDVGEKLTEGKTIADPPRPVRLITCGLSGEISVMVMVPNW